MYCIHLSSVVMSVFCVCTLGMLYNNNLVNYKHEGVIHW